MEFDFKLPDLGEGITEGELVKWRVKEGERVFEHQVVLEIETDKAIVEVPSPRGGQVTRLSVKEGEIVSVGASLMKIEVGGDEAGVAGKAVEGKPAEEKKARQPSVSVVGSVPDREEVLAAPKARALAKKLGVELSKVSGTGPGGLIIEKDIEAASSGKKAPPQKPVAGEVAGKKAVEPQKETPAGQDKYGAIEVVPIRGIRRTIAKNLMASMRNTASVTGMDDADVTELWNLRKKEATVAKEKKIHLTFLPFFMKAAQHALAMHPMINASVDEEAGQIVVKKYYNIGVAVDTPDGLMVSVVKNVEKKTILELATELQELSVKARDRKITLDELKGSTFTISNYGTFGATYATPIINPGDVAILGTGRIADRPWVVDGRIAVRKVLPLSFTFDHRIIDGAEASRFVGRVKAFLEDPGRIFIESA